MSQENKLPPIEDESFDEDKQKITLVENKCEHRNTKVISGSELRCTCGAVWIGEAIVNLHNLLQNRAK